MAYIATFLCSQGLWLTAFQRYAHALKVSKPTSRLGLIKRRMIKAVLFVLEWILKIATKSDILDSTVIEPGVDFSDKGFIILGANRIGSGTVVGERCTVGMSLIDSGIPTIGQNVFIGADCIVYGAITIGDGATLLPGTVLSKSIPAGVVMQGNPPRVVQRNYDNSSMRKSLSPWVDGEGIFTQER